MCKVMKKFNIGQEILRFSAFSAMIVGRKEVSDLIWDCHMHMVLDGVNWKSAIARHENAPEEAFIRDALARYRDLGYTYLRDGGDRWGAGAYAREIAAEFGIRYTTPLAPSSAARPNSRQCSTPVASAVSRMPASRIQDIQCEVADTTGTSGISP